MNPIMRTFGRMLQLVGISSPEDALPKAKTATDPPSWREAGAETESKPEQDAKGRDG
jgi:hypothetical protein